MRLNTLQRQRGLVAHTDGSDALILWLLSFYINTQWACFRNISQKHRLRMVASVGRVGFKERLLADGLFLAKVAMEYGGGMLKYLLFFFG
ncbi:hypothetical protein Hdeb2414_s0002g00073401 [Helianthus debilis subsp. tardiflorus]